MNSLAAYITAKRTDTKREFGGKKYAKRGELEEARLKKKQVAERTADEQKRVGYSINLLQRAGTLHVCEQGARRARACMAIPPCVLCTGDVMCCVRLPSALERCARSANLAGCLQTSDIIAVRPLSWVIFQPDRAPRRHEQWTWPD